MNKAKEIAMCDMCEQEKEELVTITNIVICKKCLGELRKAEKWLMKRAREQANE